MKSFKLFTAAILLACSLGVVSTANAQTQSPTAPCNGADIDSPCGTPSSGDNSSSLPINNNIWFLVAAAGIVGFKVTLSKSKKLQSQKA